MLKSRWLEAPQWMPSMTASAAAPEGHFTLKESANDSVISINRSPQSVQVVQHIRAQARLRGPAAASGGHAALGDLLSMCAFKNFLHCRGSEVQFSRQAADTGGTPNRGDLLTNIIVYSNLYLILAAARRSSHCSTTACLLYRSDMLCFMQRGPSTTSQASSCTGRAHHTGGTSSRTWRWAPRCCGSR